MKKLPWRSALYLVVIGYLFLDLKVYHGPLRDAMRNRRDAAVVEAKERGWAALVNLEPITREQVDLAVTRHLHQRGKTAAEVPEKNLSMIRRAALQTVIDDTLVRQHADGAKHEASAEETAAFVSAWKSGFSTPEDLTKRMAAQGLDAASLDAELARIWSRKRWLENRIEPGVKVTDEEAREWFEANRAGSDGALRSGFFEPERVRFKVIVLGSGDEVLAREFYGKLKSSEATFTDLAKARPLDAATQDTGSEQGWVARDTLSGPLAEAVFTAEPGLLEPVHGESAWYVVQLLERQPERPLTYEELRAEIIAHLEAQRTEETVKSLLVKLRKVANLQVFTENL